MTVFRARPWFLPTSLAAFLTEAWPDGPADAPSDARPDTGSDGPSDTPSGTPSDTRSADSGPTDCSSRPDTAGSPDRDPDKPADRP
ncbi:hypothetical protein TPA0598_03_01570 [Streptomyces lydicamycinicus]|uniref:Uncharacterized protein n=1 Tax=Streptomyces lydicamycinicus TaxID=1546107 RepID=A0A0P4R5Q4_9ACTN|nr:hypothetical protein TPA0598_03_01570 [Streptomyces lydicamycinicus]